MTAIYLIRHADYENPLKIWPERKTGYPLSVIGRKQAQKLARVLKSVPLVAVYTSPLTRAFETAQEISKFHDLKPLPDERLLEIKSPLAGAIFKQISNIEGNFYQDKYIKQGGEPLEEVFERMNNFILGKAKLHEGQQFVAVSHGDPIMSVKSMYLDGKLPHHYSFSGDYVAMGNGYILTFEKEKFMGISSIYNYCSI